MAILNKCVLAIVLLLLVACASVNKITDTVRKPYNEITIVAAKNVNPDINQRPSPIKIKVYELSSRTTIDNLNFDRAFYQGKVMLSDELLKESTRVLQPGEEFKLKFQPNKNTRFVAIVTAYRNIDEVKWKHVYAVKHSGRHRHPFVLSDSGIVPGKPVVDKEGSGDEPASSNAKSSVDAIKDAPDKIQDSADSVQKAGENIKGKVDGVTAPPDDIKKGVELINKKKLPNIKVPSF